MKYPFIFAAALILTTCGEKAESANAPTPAASSAAPAEAATVAEAPVSAEERGRKLFNECAVCHTVKEGDAHRVGPNLFGVVGHTAGTRDGFAYSKAMRESGIVWDDETLGSFIENPQMFLRGNRMAYAGQRDAEKRAAIIAYLNTLK